MTEKKHNTSALEWKALMEDQKDFLKPLVQEVIQQVLEAEMQEAVEAERYERTGGRKSYRSGYYRRGLITRVGRLELRVPQDREGRFSTELFGRYQRSEQALVAALAEMYVQGVSTRKVKAVTEEVRRLLMRSLRRRSGHHARQWTWERFSHMIANNPLPRPLIIGGG